MSGEAITIDRDVLARRAGEAAQQATDSARETVTAPLQALQGWGIGGNFFTTLIEGITSFFSRIGTWLSSLFGGSSTTAPTAPSATPAPPAAGTESPAPATGTTVEPPARTPTPAPANRNRGTGRH